MRTAPIFLGLCLLAGVSPAQAQQSATGTVMGPNQEPQTGLPVRVDGPRGQTVVVTDEKGRWSLYNLEPGSYKVQPVGEDAQVSFTVKERSAVDRLFSRAATKYRAPEIRLDRPATTGTGR